MYVCTCIFLWVCYFCLLVQNCLCTSGVVFGDARAIMYLSCPLKCCGSFEYHIYLYTNTCVPYIVCLYVYIYVYTHMQTILKTERFFKMHIHAYTYHTHSCIHRHASAHTYIHTGSCEAIGIHVPSFVRVHRQNMRACCLYVYVHGYIRAYGSKHVRTVSIYTQYTSTHIYIYIYVYLYICKCCVCVCVCVLEYSCMYMWPCTTFVYIYIYTFI